MKDDPALQQLRETAWRRPLTPEEETEFRRLASGPDTADWLLETRLTRALDRLPDAPMPSNFTARVLAAVERETAAPAPRGFAWPALRRWLPRLAFACVVLGLSVVGVRRFENLSQQRMADSVAALSPAGDLPSPEALVEFDTIRRLDSMPAPDVELIALMQK